MVKNVIDKHVVLMQRPVASLAQSISDIFKDVNEIYSYVVYANESQYKIVYHISETAEYNTLNAGCVITNIINGIYLAAKVEKTGIIAYEQPSLEMLCKLLQPLVRSLVQEQYYKWKKLYCYEELVQICYTSLCSLYDKGYYIHKYILRKTFINDIYLFARQYNTKGHKVISLYSTVKNSDETVTVEDTIPDTQQLEAQEDRENEEVLVRIRAEQRGIIIDLIGQRQYDQIIREWTARATTGATQRKVNSLKHKVKQLGYTDDQFRKYYS